MVKQQGGILTNQVHQQLLDMIRQGNFPEATRLPSEAELSRICGASRPVVRAALARLRGEGIIKSRRGSGSFVHRAPAPAARSFSALNSFAQVRACFEFRLAVEGEAAALAATNRTSQQLAQIEALVDQLNMAIESNQTSDVSPDYTFHLLIAQASGNRFFADLMALLSESVRTSMNLAGVLTSRDSLTRYSMVAKEHGAIVEAIRDHDPDQARTLMRRHLAEASRRLMEGLPEPAGPLAAPWQVTVEAASSGKN